MAGAGSVGTTPEVLDPGVVGPSGGFDVGAALPVLLLIVVLLAVAVVGGVLAAKRYRGDDR